MNDLAPTSHPIAERLRAQGGAFASIAVAPGGSKNMPLVAAWMHRAPSFEKAEIDGVLFLVARYRQTPEDIGLLCQVLFHVATWKTAVIVVNGRYFPPKASDTSYLTQWLQCLQRHQVEQRPPEHCQAVVRQVYQLADGEAPAPGMAFLGQAMPEQAVSADPRLRERYRVPCHFLGSYAGRTLDRDSPISPEDQLERKADALGCSACPRYARGLVLRVA